MDSAALMRVLDRYRAPTHQGRLSAATHVYEVDNPVCGDQVTMAFCVVGDRIKAVRFTAAACALTTAAASVLAEALEGRRLDDACAFDEAALARLLPQPFGPERRACLVLPLHAAHLALFGSSVLGDALRPVGRQP